MAQLDRILSQLNPQQQEAVVYNEGPLLILAGAGSGKTRTLIFKVAFLVEQKKARPEEILLVTFTNRAAEEMKERLKKLIGKTPPLTSTFHSFGARVLRKDGRALGLSPNFGIYDEKDQLEVVKQAMIKSDISVKKFNPGAVLATISQAKNELISPSEYFQLARGVFQKEVARVYPAYQKLLKEYQALDFDDLLVEAVRLFRNEKEILGKYRDSFYYILVDEYQDTNRAQYELTKLLARGRGNLCAVGDAAQSIYSWRGADFRNVLNLGRDFKNLKIINLEQNYRSTQNILAAANRVIAKNTSHPILNLWTKNPKGEKIILYQAGNEIEEALLVAGDIQSTGGQNWSDFAVLYRTNAQSRVLEEVFLKAGIPYLLVGGVRFYDRKEIKDCLAYLKLLANEADLVAYKRAQKLGKRRLAKFYEYVEKIRGKKRTTLKLLDEMLEATGYLELYDEKKEEDLSRLENIKELRSVAAEFPDLADFLEKVALIQHENLPQDEARVRGRKKNAVSLMTTHAAKGTEFKTVFLIGMEEGLFPHSRSLVEKEELEEERRLCYVGMTRAKEKLYLIYARRRLYFGQRVSNPPSRFLDDIPEYLREEKEVDLEFDTID